MSTHPIDGLHPCDIADALDAAIAKYDDHEGATKAFVKIDLIATASAVLRRAAVNADPERPHRFLPYREEDWCSVLGCAEDRDHPVHVREEGAEPPLGRACLKCIGKGVKGTLTAGDPDTCPNCDPGTAA